MNCENIKQTSFFKQQINSIFRIIHIKEVFPKSLDKHGASKEEIDKIVRMISRYAVKTYSPHFHNQLYAGIDDYGMAGSLLTDILSTSQYE